MTTPADLSREAAPDDDELARRAAIERYLRTGKYETTSPAWPGNTWEREVRAHDGMIRALVAEVNKLAAGHKIPTTSLPADLVAFTRKKVEPMVRGLFRRDEQEAVLAVPEKSVVFLTPANTDQVLLQFGQGGRWMLL